MSYIGSPAAPTIATVSDDTITTAKIDDDAVTSAKLDTNIEVGNLTVTGAGTFRAPTGDYGSIEIDGGAKNGWEGYSIGGRINFMHDNANNWGFWDDVNNQWKLYDAFNGGMRLSHAGNFKLETTSTGVDVTGDVTSSTGFFKRDGNNYVYVGASSYMGAVVNGSERMRIDNAGNLLVGTTNTNNNTEDGLRLYGGAKYASFTRNGGSPLALVRRSSGGEIQEFFYNSTKVGTVSISTTNTSYNTSSDYRLKENVIEVTDGIDRVKLLKPSRFNFIADPNTTVDGFLAHEVADVVPEAITGTKDAMRTEEYEVTPAVLDDDGNVVTEAVMGTREVPDYQGIDQSKLVPLLTAALQEAITKIETLEARVATLESA